MQESYTLLIQALQLGLKPWQLLRIQHSTTCCDLLWLAAKYQPKRALSSVGNLVDHPYFK